MASLIEKLAKEAPISSKAKIGVNDKTPYSEGTGVDASKNADPKVLNDKKLAQGRKYGELGGGSKFTGGYTPNKTYSSTIIKK
jgi:hypothetical protein